MELQRSKLIDFIQPYPFIKRIILLLPQSIRMLLSPTPLTNILKINRYGKVIIKLVDTITPGYLTHISCANEKDDKLYLGSVDNNYIAVYDLKYVYNKIQEEKEEQKRFEEKSKIEEEEYRKKYQYQD